MTPGQGSGNQGSGTPSGGRSTQGGTAARRAAREQQAPPAKTSRAVRSARSTGRAVPGGGPAATTRTTGAGAVVDPDELTSLEEERDFLLASLEDLEREHDAGDVDDTDYAALKDDYTVRAADVLRAIDGHQRRRSARDTSSARRRSPARLVGAVLGVIALAVLAGVLVAQASGRRTAGDTVSGDVRQSSRDLLLKAQDQFSQGQLLDAIKTYDQVLEISPANPEALTYKGWLLYRAAASSSGQLSESEVATLRGRALESLDAAVKADPAYPDAHIFRAIIFRDLGRRADAAAELALVRPDQIPPMMQPMVESLRGSLSGTAGSTPGTRAPSATTTP